MTKPFALTTGDPAFDPRCPVTINGYPYSPAAPAAKAGGDHEVAAPTTEKAGTPSGSESGPGGYAEGGQN